MASTEYEVVVEWLFGKDRPIAIVALRANNAPPLALDKCVRDSPFIRALPPPNNDNQYTLGWTITPEIENLQRIAVFIRRKGDENSKKEIDRTEGPTRSVAWENEVTVDPP